jgi:CHASE2 domain-containing sensor protein
MKIFGREPAFWVGVLEALIAVLVTFKIDGLSQEQAGFWIAVIVAVGGLLTAWATRDTALAALVAVVKALLVLGVAYGLHVTEEQIGLIAALVTTVGAGWLRTQTSPVSTPISSP